MKVKICGLTRREDVLFLKELGVDFAGFVFVPESPRFLEVEIAAELAPLVPSGTKRVGVFADEEPERVRSTAERCRLDILQFHGEETPEYCRGFPLPYFKAIRVRGGADLNLLKLYRPEAFLLDTFSPDSLGGTGETFDWGLARKAREEDLPIILAGGLNPENVSEAVLEVMPWGVDVSSGVESSPGIKDHAKMKAFMQSVRTASLHRHCGE